MRAFHLSVLLVVLFSVVPYLNIFGNDFTYDDHVFIGENLAIRSLGNVPSFFSETVYNLYRPLRTVLYSVTYAVWNGNVFGYHLNSVVWHVLSSVLVFLIFRKVADGFVPVVGALVFAVHPVHSERVAFITGGFDLLGIFLVLLAFLLYINYSSSRRRRFLVFSLVSFAAALFSSEEALVFPLLVVLYEFVFGDKALGIRRFVSSGFFSVVLAVFVAFRLFVVHLAARASVYPGGSLFSTLLTMLKVFVYYAWLVFVPYPLTLYRDVSVASSFFEPFVVVSFLLILSVGFAAFLLRRHHPVVSFSVGWFFIALLPFSNVLPLQILMADRYLYLASAGAALLLAYGIFRIPARSVSVLLSAVIIFSFLFLAVDRNGDWVDDVSLWEQTAKTSPHNSVVFANLGFAYEQGGRLADAKSSLLRSISLNPLNDKAHYNLGIVYMRQKDYVSSAREFMLAINVSPDYAQAYDSLGMAYYYSYLESYDSLLLSAAEEAMSKAISVSPSYFKPYSDLGIVKGQRGSFNESIALLHKSLALNPWNHEAYYNMGIIYEFLNRTEMAEASFLRAVALQPSSKLYRQRAAQYS